MTARCLRPAGLLTVALVAVSCGSRTHTRVVTTPVPDLADRPIGRITVIGIKGFPWWPFGAGVESETARLLAESLRARNPALAVPHPADDWALLDEAGLGSAWATLTDLWLETGIADAVRLRDMADAVGAEAVLGGVLLSNEMTPGFEPDPETGSRPWPSRHAVAIRLWLFDTRDGALLWEAAAVSTTFGPPQVPLEDAVVRAIQDLTAKLPRLTSPSRRR
jgi:hypothetical protein